MITPPAVLCSCATADKTASKILMELFRRRRLLPSEPSSDKESEAEAAPHYPVITRAINEGRPITLILPAFPAKSPSRRKTLSHLPDHGEELALMAINALCEDIRTHHEAGAKVIIFSDGRVFADVVHIPDQDVTAYNASLRQLAAEMKLTHIEFFGLDDVYSTITDYATLREELMVEYGETLATLQDRCRAENHAAEMYKGITRFMFEDFCGLDKFCGLSKSHIQRLARLAAYRVIQRSNAWSKLLADRFPETIRLSIHPQARVSEKIGIALVDATNAWATPWHSVVLKHRNGVSLVHRETAERMGAALIFKNGRPSHFQSLETYGN